MVKRIKDDVNDPTLKRGDDVTKGEPKAYKDGSEWDNTTGDKSTYTEQPKEKKWAKVMLDEKFWGKRSDGPGLTFQKASEGPDDDDGFSEDYAKKGTGGEVEKGWLSPGGPADNADWAEGSQFDDCGKGSKYGDNP